MGSETNSARKSSLKDYNYDFVLATTQKSINATMKQYLDGIKEKLESTALYARDPTSQDRAKKTTAALITATDLNNRINAAFPGKFPKGIDPLSIPAEAEGEDSRIKALRKVGFKYGFRIVAGIPDHYESKAEIPDLVTLSKGASAVSYRMLCKDFDIVELITEDDDNFWNVYSQAKQPKPWVFVAQVDMRLNSVGSQFAGLPEAVQNAVKNLDDSMFSIEQLVLDLSNTALQKPATIEGLDTGGDLYEKVQRFFANQYCKELADHGKPVFNYTVKHKAQTSTLIPTDLDFLVVPYMGDDGKELGNPTAIQKQLATLNYLCMTDKKSLPASNKAFNWNWVSENEYRQFDGMISINRNTFTEWFLKQIKPQAVASCFKPKVNVTPGAWHPNFRYWREPISESDLSINRYNNGSRVLDISWNKQDEDGAGLDWALGSLRYRNEYSATVDFYGSTIKVVVHGIIWAQLKVGQSWNTANVVNKTWTSEWGLGVDGSGKIQVSGEPVLKDESEDDKINGFSDFFTGANDVFQGIRQNSLSNVPFGPFPFRALGDFVFPGGRSFTFKGFKFSENQDLLCAITYTDPTK
jgi:hypothetical protein